MSLVALLRARRLFALPGVLAIGLVAGCAAPQATSSNTEQPPPTPTALGGAASSNAANSSSLRAASKPDTRS